MTKITANLIRLLMASVWAAISIHNWQIVEVSQNFIVLALALASSDGISALSDTYNKSKSDQLLNR